MANNKRILGAEALEAEGISGRPAGREIVITNPTSNAEEIWREVVSTKGRHLSHVYAGPFRICPE
jgi:hypothetical protein